MPSFFARPNLSDEQFKQLAGTILTLSGQTLIGTLGGLTLATGSTNSGGVIITADGAPTRVGQVLTYDGGSQKICLMPFGAGGDPLYPSGCKTPSIVSVGGIPINYTLTGKTLSTILQNMLVPTLNPTLTAPYISTFSSNLTSTTCEVGCLTTIDVTTILNVGAINPQYTSASSCRSNGAVAHIYTPYGIVPAITAYTASLTNTYTVPAKVGGFTLGTNSFVSACIAYQAGVQPKNSSGGDYSTPLPASATTILSLSLTGIYPYFYGKIASGCVAAGVNRPDPYTTICSCIIAADLSRNANVLVGPVVVVGDSTGTIYINFSSTADDYIWFAIPNASTCKLNWADTVVTVNNGSIGGAISPGGNLFPDPGSVTPITTVCWAGQTYKVYVSNYQSQAINLYALSNS